MSVPLEGTTGSPASGTNALLALMVNQQLAGRQCGAPWPVVNAKAAPAAPTTATSGTGVTATKLQHAVRAMYGTPNGSAWGPVSVASAGLNVTNQGVTVTYTPDSAAVAHSLFRKENDAGTAANTTAGLSDITWSGATYTGAQRARFEVKITTAAGTDKFEWRKILLDQDTGVDVSAGSWSAEISITGSAQTLSNGVTVTFAATTGHALADLWTLAYRCNFLHIWTNWNATSTTFTDTTASGSEDLDVPYSPLDEYAANWGAFFQRMDTGTDFSRKDKPIVPGELTGGAAPPRAIPGPVDFGQSLPIALRTASLIPLLTSVHGKPVVTQAAGKPEWTYAWPGNPYTLARNSVSLDAILDPGGDMRPKAFWANKATDIEIPFALAKEALAKVKLTGTGDTEMGFGVVGTKTGTYASVPVVRGVPGYSTFLTDSLTVKISDAPTAGTFTVVVKVGSGSYSTYKSTIYYDTTTHRVIKGGRNQSEWVELLDTAGRALGQDVGANRKPLSIWFAGDVTLLAANDTFTIAPFIPKLGVYSGAEPTGPSSDGSFTGQRLREMLTPLFAPTRISLFRGVNSPDTFLEVQGADFKYMRPSQPVHSLGPEASSPVDVDVLGKIAVSISFDRRWISREFERVLKTDARYQTSIEVDGAPIRTNPGVLGAYEQFIATLKQSRVDSASATVSTDKVLPEKVTVVGERPDDGSGFFSQLTVVASTFFDFSGL